MATWQDILASPEFANTFQRLQAQLARQHLAIPGASPELRALPGQEAARQVRLQDIGHRLDLGRRALDVKRGALDLGRRQLDRFAGQLPWAAGLGFANLGLSGLSAFGNIQAARRSEARGQQLMQQQAQTATEQRRGLEALLQSQQQLAPLYQNFLQQFPPPASLGG